MEHVRELQVLTQLEVRVWGMDVTDKPFFQTAHTIEISAQGARLAGVTCLKGPGEIIGVQHGDQKARFRVAWIGMPGTPEQDQIGIESLESDRCIWAEALQEALTKDTLEAKLEAPAPATAPAPDEPAQTPGSSRERRRYPRYRCTGTVQVSRDGGGPALWMTLTDIGLGGCYVETLSPLPLNTNVGLLISVEEMSIRGRGKVRTSHPTVGNGIAFTQMPAEDWRRLQELAARLAATRARQAKAPAPAPVAAPAPAAAAPSAETIPSLEALLLLLEKKGVLTREEFIAELMAFRRPAGSGR
jgi:PilZ domain